MEKKKRNNGCKGKKHTAETRQKISKSMLGNLNAELYSIDEASDLFSQMLALSKDTKYTFIKQITTQYGVSYSVVKSLTERFPTLKNVYEIIKENLETNCYVAVNQDKLKIQIALLNLKSNYGWTDRSTTTTDITTQGQPLQISNLITFISDDNPDEETDEE